MKHIKIFLCLTLLLSCFILIGCGANQDKEEHSEASLTNDGSWMSLIENDCEERNSYSGSGDIIGQYEVLHISEDKYASITEKDVSDIAKAIKTFDLGSKYDYIVISPEDELVGIVFPGTDAGYAERGSLGEDCTIDSCVGTYEDDGSGNYTYIEKETSPTTSPPK